MPTISLQKMISHSGQLFRFGLRLSLGMARFPFFKTPAARRGGVDDVEMLAGRRVPLCLVELFLNACCLSPGLNSLL